MVRFASAAESSDAMTQEKRFGKRIAMPSTVQIIRELKILMRHDAEHAEAAVAAGSTPLPVAAPFRPDAQ